MIISTAPTRTAARAFTLIEVLLAIGIFAIVLVAINTVFYGALRLRAATTRAVDEAVPLNQAFAILRRDLQGALPPGTNGALAGDFKSGTIGGTLGVGQNNGLEFYTTSAVISDAAPWGDLQKVSYELRDPANRTGGAGKDLIRSVTRNLLATTALEVTEQTLLGGVERLEFLCYNGSDWRETWDTSAGDVGLPSAMRVRILLAGNNGASAANRQPLELLVPLVAQANTNQTQVAGGGG
jgi:type II secretion system protein J